MHGVVDDVPLLGDGGSLGPLGFVPSLFCCCDGGFEGGYSRGEGFHRHI